MNTSFGSFFEILNNCLLLLVSISLPYLLSAPLLILKLFLCIFIVQSAGRNASDSSQMEFEAKSARDGAWFVFWNVLNYLFQIFHFLIWDNYWFLLLKCSNTEDLFVFFRYDVTLFLSHRSIETGDPVMLSYWTFFLLDHQWITTVACVCNMEIGGCFCALVTEVSSWSFNCCASSLALWRLSGAVYCSKFLILLNLCPTFWLMIYIEIHVAT